MPAETPAEIRFAHLSDWHATTISYADPGFWRAKRLSGWASWQLSRRRHHAPRILEAAFHDVHAAGVDRVLVTGDLTHVSLESEFRMAARQLASLGTPGEVFLIPGNHDCYVATPAARSWDHWARYLASDVAHVDDPDLLACLAASPAEALAPRHEDYPTFRRLEGVAFVGLCSAIPTPIFRAGGLLGRKQLERLDRLLALLGERGLCRVLMIHHPIVESDESKRRALRDAAELRAILAHRGAELVVHGHKHRRREHALPGPDGAIPIVGVPSSSEIGSKPDKRAQYHLYTVRSEPAPSRHEITLEIRGFEPASGGFERVERRRL